MDRRPARPWLRLPERRGGTIRRSRLDDLLSEASRTAPIVAVVAGAGYGKTTALSAWARDLETERPVAWIDAKMAAPAPGGLWSALWLACHRAGDPDGVRDDPGQDAAGTGTSQLHGPHGVLELLERSPVAPVIVLDDLHAVTDRAALESLDLMIAYLPVGATLVVAARWDPPLRLADARVRGQLREIRTCDLAFEPEETQQLLELHGLRVDDVNVRRLTQVADGWPIALRLAATAMVGGADVDRALEDLAGHEGRLARYLAQEVLEQLPVAWREVLTTSSIAERFHGDLAARLTGVDDAGLILEQAAAATGLLHPVPDEPGWLEAHPLARTFLRVALERAGGERVAGLHHEAATWFAEREEWSRAIEHALHDPARTCLSAIMARIDVEPLLRSSRKGQQVASRLVGVAPARWPVGRPLALAVAVLANADAAAAFGVSEALRHTRFESPADERLRSVALARVWRNLGRNDLAAALLRQAPWDDASTDELLLLRAEEVLAGCDGAAYGTIRVRALDVLAQARTCEADRLVLHLYVALAALALIEGDPRQASSYAEDATSLGQRFGRDLAIPLAEARVIRVAATLELGEPHRFTCSSLAPLASATRSGPVHLRLAALGLDIRLRWREGGDPRLLLDEVSGVWSGVDLDAADPGFVVSIIELELLLAEAVQDLPRAETAVGRLPARYGRQPEAAFLRAHLHRLRGAYAQARRELRPVVRGEVTPLWPAMRLRILVLDGVLAELEGAPDTASLEEAVEIGSASGRQRPFLELGSDALRVLVARRDALPPAGGFVDDLISALERMAPALARTESLTRAEVKVLQRLASMATLQEIADGLHLSRNTVKTHTSSIYRKLGVGSRRAAVGRGRELGLLRSDGDLLG